MNGWSSLLEDVDLAVHRTVLQMERLKKKKYVDDEMMKMRLMLGLFFFSNCLHFVAWQRWRSETCVCFSFTLPLPYPCIFESEVCLLLMMEIQDIE